MRTKLQKQSALKLAGRIIPRSGGYYPLSFDRVRNQRARNKNKFLPYREVTPSRRQLQSEMVLNHPKQTVEKNIQRHYTEFVDGIEATGDTGCRTSHIIKH